jgi:nucleotide-binding universal stress UspA family protein
MKEKSAIPINQEEINSYLKDIRKIKVMTPDRERELAEKMLSGKLTLQEKEEIQKELVEGNLRFVITVSKQYQNQGLDLPDLIAEGNYGLLKAIENFEPKNIVFATNGEEGAKAVVEALNKFQSAFGATVHVLNVNTPNNFYRTRTMEKMLKDFAEASGLKNFTINIYNDANEEDGILNFAEDVKADMIAIGTHARTGFSRILSSNISEDVVNHSNLPVLTVKI